MKRKIFLFAAVFALAAFFVSNSVIAEDVFPIGTKLDNFTMSDPNGNKHSFDDLKGENGALIVFLSEQCPVVKQYDDRIMAIAEDYKEKGITFIGIYPNVTEPVDLVKSHVGKVGYEFPVLMDNGHVLADKLGATKTPEVYYFNADNVLEYHGAIDNDRSGDNVSKPFLKTAFDEKLGGKEITEKTTKAFGCSIKRGEKGTMRKGVKSDGN